MFSLNMNWERGMRVDISGRHGLKPSRERKGKGRKGRGGNRNFPRIRWATRYVGGSRKWSRPPPLIAWSASLVSCFFLLHPQIHTESINCVSYGRSCRFLHYSRPLQANENALPRHLLLLSYLWWFEFTSVEKNCQGWGITWCDGLKCCSAEVLSERDLRGWMCLETGIMYVVLCENCDHRTITVHSKKLPARCCNLKARENLDESLFFCSMGI